MLEHLDELVVKAVDEAGGYGMLMGPQASAAEREEFRARIIAEPAQVHRPAPHRAVDLPDLDRRRAAAGAAARRPAAVHADRPKGTAGCCPAASRASRCVEGSYVVNSSQGGGSKDTWVQADAAS